jgi:branched-chain amino acid transport system substrate-binding protein
MSISAGISRRSCVLSALASLSILSHSALAQTTGAGTVSIGMVRPMSGPLKAVAEGYMETVRAALDAVNAQGGLSGAKLELVALDDAGDPARTAAQAKVLAAASDVVAVLGIAGTGNVLGAAPILQDAKLPLIGPFTGTEALRSAQYRSIFHVRAGYDDEIETLVQTMAARHPTGRAVVMYQDDPFGNGTYGTFLKFSSGLAPQMKVSAFKFDRASGDLADPQGVIAALKNADGVLLLAAPKAAAKLLAVSRQQRNTATVYTLSVVDALGLVKEVGPAMASGVLISQVMPNPKKSTAKLAREYRQLAESARLPLSYAGMEGYVAVRVLLETLHRVKAPITRDKVFAALDDLGRVDLGGFTIQYSKNSRSGSKFVDLSMISPSGSVID